ncbi:hypothetical protein KIN20_020504 [Parelaphostrongylus tenuis]|uniref:Uncharacterized protein n=1 Tax=Parelaphostrongylus tenuis TaxID=148309 RepID=A0AAD5QQX3_PARTN|nr:hypothetical protein KIN20_020504 [Parelaphostrongylus tenuis]
MDGGSTSAQSTFTANTARRKPIHEPSNYIKDMWQAISYIQVTGTERDNRGHKTESCYSHAEHENF